jgi:hypothetical protein
MTGVTAAMAGMRRAAAASARSEWDPALVNIYSALSNSNQDYGPTVATGGQNGARTVNSRSTGKWFGEVTLLGDRTTSSVSVVTTGHTILTFAQIAGRDNSFGATWFSNVFYRTLNTSPINSGVAADGSANINDGVTSTVGIAIDAGARLCWFYRNGVIITPGDPAAATGGLDLPATGGLFIVGTLVSITGSVRINGGQTAFANSLPSGYSAFGV